MARFLAREGRRALVLISTSHDTGGAVARVFCALAGLDALPESYDELPASYERFKPYLLERFGDGP